MATESFFRNMIITKDSYESFLKVMNRNKKIKVEDHSHVIEITGDNISEELLNLFEEKYGKHNE